MKLQSLLFPQTGICTEEKMYFRRHGTIDFTWDKDYLNMFRDSSITFDTYFNGCSAEKWFKYTKIKKIRIFLHVKGQFRITLMRKEKNLDGIMTKFLHEETFGEVRITVQDGVYMVEGKWLLRIIRGVNFDDYDGLSYFERLLQKSGVIDRLREAGCQEGDTVSIYDLEFEFIE